MDINCINFFQSTALNIYPNWEFWFENKPSFDPENTAKAAKQVNPPFWGQKSCRAAQQVNSSFLAPKILSS
jgi:aminoglycoside N3'-acetyltransferase